MHLPPVVPSKIVAVHLNHRSRVAEFRTRLPGARPTSTSRPRRSTRHGGAVVRPEGCQYLNYEGEVAIVIGRTCRNVAPAEAGDYIAGYTIANDFGLHDFRDTDAGSMLRVKGSDTLAPLGPGLVTGWDFHGKRLRTYVNGEVVAGRRPPTRWSGTCTTSSPTSPAPSPSTPATCCCRAPRRTPGRSSRATWSRSRSRASAGWPTTSSPARRRSATDFGAQPSRVEEVLSTALGGDWEFRGIRPPHAESGASTPEQESHGMDLNKWLAARRSRRTPTGRRPSAAVRPGTRRWPSTTSGSPPPSPIFTERLQDNYPFFHPRYAGQMLKPPHPAAVVGYLAAMLINPNNHALDGGPATAAMEREVVAAAGRACSASDTHLGHLTTSGTIANLEALFVAREAAPRQGIAYSAEAHYTHARMCGVLGVQGHAVPGRRRGPDGPRRAGGAAAHAGGIGTVVLTAGTTGLGAVDPVHEALALRERYGVRMHVDAAYGGFFTLLAGADGPERPAAAPWQAIAQCDSVVVDPHKHGLQPYGCGAVLFRRPGGRPVLPARLAVHLLHLRASCTWARSAWSAPAPARRRPRCGSPSSCCRRTRTGSARCWRPAGGRRCAGRS